MLRALSFVLLLLTAAPVRAEGPEDTVRWIYASLIQRVGGPGGLAYLSAPERRGQFMTRRMVAFYDANDSYGDDMMAACVDFAFEIPGQDFDEAEIARTLSITSSGDDTQKVVTARFSNFGQPAEVAYSFVPEDGVWKIDDIAGPGWRVSEIPCSPKGAAPAQGGITSYCFLNGDDTMRLDLHQDGRASFDFLSWQANGHTCGGQGVAGPIAGGWAYEEAIEGAICRIEIMVTEDGGLRLTDRDWACKPRLCGQRAVLDGLSFPLASQVDCAALP